MKTAALFLLAISLAGAQQPPAPPAKRGIKVGTETVKSGLGSAKLPRGFAVLIAGDPGKSRFAERDARLLYDTLVSSEAGNFAEQDVRLLTGAKVTAESVRDALERWLPSMASPNDRVVVYFVGEAFVQSGKAYLALPGGVAYPVDKLSATLAERVKAPWKAVFLDAARGGGRTSETSNQSVNQRLGALAPGILTVAASRRQESSLEDPDLDGGHGLFAYYLARGLSGEADENADGFVVAGELIEYVRARVRDHAQRLGAKQTPSESGEFEPGFQLAYNPSAAEPKHATGSLLVTAEDAVEVLLDGKPAGTIREGSPLAISNLSPGKHTLQGVKGSARSALKEIVVLPGKEVPVRLTF